MWQYIKTNKLQDSEEREFINCDVHLQAVSFYFHYNLNEYYYLIDISLDYNLS